MGRWRWPQPSTKLGIKSLREPVSEVEDIEPGELPRALDSRKLEVFELFGCSDVTHGDIVEMPRERRMQIVA